MTKLKITSLIVSCLIALALLGGVVFGIIASNPQFGASTNSSRLFSSNLLSGANAVSRENAKSLINAVGGLDYDGVKKWSELKNGSNPIIFPMGTVPGTSTALEWEIVHRDGDIITVWLNQNYTMEYFNYDGKTYSSGIFAGTTKTDYDQYGNYSRSTLRQATQQIYTNLIASSYYPILDSIVVSPQTAESIEGYIDYQASQGNTKYYYTDGSRTSITNGLNTQTSTTNPNGWTWDSTVYDDKFWIPSYYEVFNKGNGVAGSSNSGTNYFDGGYWGFSAYSDLGFSTATLKSSSVTASYCWLRSGSL